MLVLEETGHWVQAFSAATRATAAPEPRSAGVNLALSNGNAVSAIWELVLGGGAPGRRRGRTTKRAILMPGNPLRGRPADRRHRARSAERAVTAASGEAI